MVSGIESILRRCGKKGKHCQSASSQLEVLGTQNVRTLEDLMNQYISLIIAKHVKPFDRLTDQYDLV